MDVREWIESDREHVFIMAVDKGELSYCAQRLKDTTTFLLAQADVVDAARELIVCPSGVRVTTTPLRTALARLEAIEKEVCGD